MRVVHRAAGHFTVAGLGLAAMALSWSPLLDEAFRAGTTVAGGMAALIGAINGYRRRGVLTFDTFDSFDTFDGNIRHTRGGRTVAAARADIAAVEIRRPLLGLVRPSVYAVRIAGAERVFAEHWFDGRRAMALARGIATALEVPIVDPVGVEMRASAFAPARWLGHGQEWKLLPVIVPICVLIVWLMVSPG